MAYRADPPKHSKPPRRGLDPGETEITGGDWIRLLYIYNTVYGYVNSLRVLVETRISRKFIPHEITHYTVVESITI